ncbi:spermatogenesis-associated protein 13 [Platysternon megacephalum]|uniref:Spermatogenesis-associated protein 13 n=1 Tax=Platysternon megacephalum TaxID=55544 RepID=A0A4D9EWX1_9SAUR|nr:spermatogenesis-associated protein 13 [Platysternon megacephalum]
MQQEVPSCEECDAGAGGSPQTCSLHGKVHTVNKNAFGARRYQQMSKASSSSGGKMQLLETEFSLSIRELIDLHLLHQDSIPAFLSAVTLELFSRQTCA